jgi:hypothetical protein
MRTPPCTGSIGGRAAPLVEKAFPGTVIDGAVDRGRLGAAVLGDPARMRELEAIVHPLVREEEEAFLERAALAAIAVLDIPLLFETGGEARCDACSRGHRSGFRPAGAGSGAARHVGGEISINPV